MDDNAETPVEEREPEGGSAKNAIWMRGLFMILLAVLFGIAETILGVCAIIQWLWMFFAKEKNERLFGFGRDLGDWMRDVALFQTGVTEEKPFPWKRWGA